MPPSSESRKRPVDDTSPQMDPPKRQVTVDDECEENSSNVSSHISAGILKSITVENFMCHRKLRVDFCRNVNFVHGQNGSGKSAILAALQICLGAQARRTHRARNLQELIRHGASAAKVRVTIHNRDGFREDIYGDAVTIERSIAKSGAAFHGYKLLNAQGKEVSRSRKDLDELLDALNIQVENPVAVLDQEQAKLFLTGKASDKYRFFLKATELERVDRSYANTVERVQELIDAQERIRASLLSAQNHVEQLKRVWEEHRAVDVIYDKLLTIQLKFSWAYFASVKDTYEDAQNALENFRQKAAQRQEELTQAQSAVTQEDLSQQRATRIQELTLEAQEQAIAQKTLEEQLKTLLVPYKTAERQALQLQRQQEQASQQLQHAQIQLDQARQQVLQQAAESEQAQRTQKLQALEKQLAELQAQTPELKQTVTRHLRAFEEIDPQVQECKEEVKRVANQCRGTQMTIKDLQRSSKTDSWALLGPRVDLIHGKVQDALKAKQFRGPVLGPIGKYIKMASGKEQYAQIAEIAMGNVLDRFIVTNEDDRRVFQKFRQQAGCQNDCNVFIVPAHRRYSTPAPPEGIDTVTSALIIEEDLVFNCLVDNARIDQKALSESKQESQDALLVTHENGRHGIRGDIKEVYYLPRGDYWTCRNGMLGIFSNEKKLRQTIGVDKTAAVQQAEAEAQALQHEYEALQAEESRLEHLHTNHQREWNKAKRALRENEIKIVELREKTEQIRSEMETTANETLDTTEFEEDVAQATQMVEQLAETLAQMQADLDARKPAIDQVRLQLDETNMRNQKVMHDLRTAQEELTKFLDTQSQLTEKLEKKRKKVEQYREAMEKHEEKLRSIKVQYDESLFRARKLHWGYHQRLAIRKANGDDPGSTQDEQFDETPTLEELEAIEPVEPENDWKYYQARAEATKEKLECERKKRKVSNQDAAVAYEKYARAKADLSAKTDQLKDIETKIDLLNADIKERKKKWRAFRSYLTQKTNDKFGEFLALNKYAGNLEFDHKENDLNLLVQKNTNNADGATKDVKALSGGERSYTTMCLLLALGESLETPFRVLDEFDVFLDTATRKLTIQALIHVAQKLDHRQFIFITPQDVSSIKSGPKVKIFKLTPPERNINAGGLSQQTLSFSQE